MLVQAPPVTDGAEACPENRTKDKRKKTKGKRQKGKPYD